MEVGYIRVSTEEQNTARQFALMDARGIKKVFSEKESGKNAERAQLKAMLETNCFDDKTDSVLQENDE